MLNSFKSILVFKKKPRVVSIKMKDEPVEKHIKIDTDKAVRAVIDQLANAFNVPSEHTIDYGLILDTDQGDVWLSDDSCLSQYRIKGQVEKRKFF